MPPRSAPLHASPHAGNRPRQVPIQTAEVGENRAEPCPALADPRTRFLPWCAETQRHLIAGNPGTSQPSVGKRLSTDPEIAHHPVFLMLDVTMEHPVAGVVGDEGDLGGLVRQRVPRDARAGPCGCWRSIAQGRRT